MGLLARIKTLLTRRKSAGYTFTSEPMPESTRHFFYVRIPEAIGPVERGEKYARPLEAALADADVGEVTGGGTQMGEGNTIAFVGLDVEVTAPQLNRGLEIIRQTLRACGAPLDTVIEEYDPEHRELPL